MTYTLPDRIAAFLILCASVLGVSVPAVASATTGNSLQGSCQDCSLSTRDLVFESGDSLASLLDSADVGPATALQIADSLESIMDPRAIAPGARMTLQFAASEAAPQGRILRQLTLTQGPDRQIAVSRSPEEGYAASVRQPKHERSIVVEVLPIESSLYASAAEAGASTRIILQAQRVLGNRVDFQRELRAGDRVTVAYERLEHPTSSAHHAGKVLAASLEQRARTVSLYRFEKGDEISGFFDQDGASVQLALLRNPVRRSRLSSSFGRRNHPILGYARMHEGLDFAAARGERVVAAGQGRVVRAGRYGSYGKFVRIKHDDGFSTAYAHLSEIAGGLKPGVRVGQGETIGYVGATGLATGPNLHFEVRRNGEPVNPAELELPPRRKLQGRTLEAFQAERRRLDQLVSRQLDERRDESVDVASANGSQDAH